MKNKPFPEIHGVNPMTNTYFKSFVVSDESAHTLTYNPRSGKTDVCQSIKNILRERKIKPNTRHNALPLRLCTSAIKHHRSYSTAAYRPEGLLFETDTAPSFCAPCDIMTLTTLHNLDAAQYAKNYGATLIDGYERFIFDSIEHMFAIYPQSEKAIEEVNAFRQKKGLDPITAFAHNEVCFTEDLNIRPRALIGRSKQILAIAHEYPDVPRYDTLDEYRRRDILGEF